jgi:hypothetical protein
MEPDSNNVRLKLWIKALSGILFIILIFIQLPFASGQNNTLYLMHSIPQANQLNPAIMHPCRIYVSLPIISSLRENIRNTGFGFHDVYYSGNEPGEYFMDLDKLDNKLKRINYSLANTDIDLFGIGFPHNEWYLTIGVSSHTASQGSYPHDIVNFADRYWDSGAGIPDPVHIQNLKLNSTAWNSIGFSASKEVRKGLRIGLRVKYLNGMANVTTPKSSIEMSTAGNPPFFQASVNYQVNTSLPLSLVTNPGGILGSISLETALHNLAGNYLFTPNHGAAVDAGLIYDIDDATQLSASFTDLGFIRWKKDLNQFSVNETFVYSAADLDQFINAPGQIDLAKSLYDTVRNSIHVSEINSYFTLTPINIYGGITRQVLRDLKAGAMTWIEISSGHIRPSITLSLNFTPFKAFAATVSYTLMNNKYNQIGTGLAVGNRGAQFYIITDNIVVRYVKDAQSSLRWPYNARMLSLRFGMNLFFGCDQKNIGNGNKHYPGFKARDDCPAYW